MTQSILEQRVAVLEKQMAEMKAQQANGTLVKPWLRTMGLFVGDEGMKEIFDEALKFRAKDRQKAQRRKTKKAVSQRAK